jgi:hypothetical protein
MYSTKLKGHSHQLSHPSSKTYGDQLAERTTHHPVLILFPCQIYNYLSTDHLMIKSKLSQVFDPCFILYIADFNLVAIFYWKGTLHHIIMAFPYQVRNNLRR